MDKHLKNGMGYGVIISLFLYKLHDEAKKIVKKSIFPDFFKLEVGQCMVTSGPNFSMLTVSNEKIKGTFALGTCPELSENVISF